MVVVMRGSASDEDVTKVINAVGEVGGEAFVSRGKHQTIIGLVGDLTQFAELPLHAFPGVEDVIRVSKPYKLVSIETHPRPSTVWVGDVPIGRDTFTLLAGPCAVESEDQTRAACRMAKDAGASILRGGAYKPRTSPYAFQGLGEQGLDILADVSRELEMPFVTEVVTPADVETVAAKADMLQVGTRNMQNFQLLKEVGLAGKPVLLKRGMTATIDEWIMAAEYIAHTGNLQVVLCERGIRTYEPSTRNTLDVSAVPVAQSLTHLPVIIDPSHSGGKRDLVLPLTKAAIAVGADGVIIDVHPRPELALCDGPQALVTDDLIKLREVILRFTDAADREVATPTAGKQAGAWGRSAHV
ncbi:MAG: 3-deoxy-7-phosphoheptulonate synthase [Actinobacteria bacterium]|nr:3-deoxy-7-phosphoheptulonate synthase [Actinomycetota bacterium]